MADMKQCDNCKNIREPGWSWIRVTGMPSQIESKFDDLCSMDCLIDAAVSAKANDARMWAEARAQLN
jgi:hypothetical protein